MLVLVGAGIALRRLPALPESTPPEAVLPALPAPPVATRDTIDQGENVPNALMQAGLTRRDANAVVKAAETRVKARREIPFSLYSDSAAAPVREVELQVDDDRSIRVLRIGTEGWSAVERRELWKTDTITVRGPIVGSLVETMRNAGRGAIGLRGRLETAYALAEAFEYKIDVGRDLQVGDSVVAVVERRRTAFGAERVGPLLAGGLYHDREWLRAIRFTTPGGTTEYYDADGRPMRTTFLAAPVEFRRMSSAFGLRSHPLLGTVRRHAGIDFSAPFGTPVRAVGDGAVIKAGYAGGFGRLVEVRHRDGMVTRYGHLRGFAAGLREGQVVTQGQVIGFVGSTGLSTGPHLHFETLVNGVSREPTRTLREASGVTLTGPSRGAFAAARDAIAVRLGLTQRVAPVERTALRSGGMPTAATSLTPPGTGVGATK
ncbi:MAG: M23 family metallopeptidase [Gemmatimonadota bacterium]